MNVVRDFLEEAVSEGILDYDREAIVPTDTISSTSKAQPELTTSGQNALVLFLGAAISTFKPAQLPTWNEFVRLLWSSALDVAGSDPDSVSASQGLSLYFDRLKHSIPNYFVTETISRRLGQDYLGVLKAFEAERLADETWAINSVHGWAAKCLSTGSITAIVTTNFDNYLEKALEVVEANCYHITGDPHLDGRHISAKLPYVTPSRKLVLIVNGQKSFSFARLLMPQLGKGKITFLLKLHGSCYDPASCIDTRLQRAQGLPSFATDILDTMLRRATWLVAGFSGSDMNDNLDYLRFLSNKRHARIVWLAYPDAAKESALVKLSDLWSSGGSSKICNARFQIAKTSVQDQFPRFASKIAAWANGLGSSWCRLLVLDLVVMFEHKSGELADPGLLQKYGGTSMPRQDWNTILSSMLLADEEHQIAPAKSCSIVWQRLSSLVASNAAIAVAESNPAVQELNSELKDIAAHHLDFEARALSTHPPQLHAQAWVMSALTGIACLLGGQTRAAVRAFEISSGMARVVGEFDSYQLLVKMTSAAQVLEKSASKSTAGHFIPAAATPYVTFDALMDNANAKMNRYGVPPEAYLRALLHRAVLFANGIGIPANALANSTVFLEEILFQGELDEVNQLYLKHIIPLLPTSLENVPRRLRSYRETRASGYLFEDINERHISFLDDYYDDPVNASRIVYYKEKDLQRDYAAYFQTQLSPANRGVAVEHLMQLWHHLEATGGWNVHRQDTERSSAAREAAEDLTASLFLFFNNLNLARANRSCLYRFADLFAEANDRETFLSDLKEDTDDQTKAALLAARDRIVAKPWLYGPFCHELFDTPYLTNIPFSVASRINRDTFVFLEEEDIPSLQFMSANRAVTSSSGKSVSLKIPSESHKCSSLLLSQASKTALLKAREDLAPVREAIFNGSSLGASELQKIRDVMAVFESRALSLPVVNITTVTELAGNVRSLAAELLQRCIFLVRKGRPLDLMYEEAEIMIPGLVALHQAELQII